MCKSGPQFLGRRFDPGSCRFVHQQLRFGGHRWASAYSQHRLSNRPTRVLPVPYSGDVSTAERSDSCLSFFNIEENTSNLANLCLVIYARNIFVFSPNFTSSSSRNKKHRNNFLPFSISFFRRKFFVDLQLSNIRLKEISYNRRKVGVTLARLSEEAGPQVFVVYSDVLECWLDDDFREPQLPFPWMVWVAAFGCCCCWGNYFR